MVKPLEDDCKITIHKNKWSIVGQQILPLCKIVISKLKPFTEDRVSFWKANQIYYRMFPLDSHDAVVDIVLDNREKAKHCVGDQNLTLFRDMLRTILLEQQWKVSIFSSSDELYSGIAQWLSRQKINF